jgi:hypothetical protein
MSGNGADWAALASEHERLAGTTGTGARPGQVSPGRRRPAQWAELASQRERLVEFADPLPGLASSERGTASFRLVVPAA